MPGRIDEAKGKIKETVGRATGNERMRAEGAEQKTAGKVGREVGGAVDQMKGNAKMAAGKLVGNKRLQTEGQVDDLKGTARRAG